jgi:hypothetical protein
MSSSPAPPLSIPSLIARKPKFLGFAPLEAIHQAQGFANDFLRRSLAAGPDLGFDEIRQRP